MELNKRKRRYLGYQTSSKVSNRYLNILAKELGNPHNLNYKEISTLERLDIESVIEQTKKFYQKYFDIHDIYYISLQSLKDNLSTFASQKDALQAYNKLYQLLTIKSPFEVPIELTSSYSHSGIGKLEKNIVLFGNAEDDDKLADKKVPMSKIILSNKINILTPSTYAHEIAHTQQESHVGYATDFSNKEVISIFIEKLSALETDPTGFLLKLQERARFSYLYDNLRIIMFQNIIPSITEEDIDKAYLEIQSALLAEKLFDNYINERKQKNKDKYIYSIQRVFDGKITVEEMLSTRNVTINNSFTSQLIKKHL